MDLQAEDLEESWPRFEQQTQAMQGLWSEQQRSKKAGASEKVSDTHSEPEPDADDEAFEDSEQEPDEEPCQASTEHAFATAIFGTNPVYFVEAAVMGASLSGKTTNDKLCLHTDEVPAEWQAVLRNVGWKLHKVQHIPYSEEVYECRGYAKGRFSQVFTKLRVIGLEMYKKVVMLDSDMLIRSNLDGIFERKAPAAVRRHSSGKYADNEIINNEHFFDRQGKQVGGINAGFVLLCPSTKDLQRMEFQLRNPGACPGHLPFKNGPEQDYLTRFYAGQWHSLGIEWNFQLHHIAHCSRPGHLDSTRMTLDLSNIKVIHFSGKRSPAEWILKGYSKDTNYDFDRFVEEVLMKEMMERLERDISVRRSRSERSKLKVSQRMREITKAAALEWKEQLEKLMEESPLLCQVLEACTTGKKQCSQATGGRRQQCKRKRSTSWKYHDQEVHTDRYNSHILPWVRTDMKQNAEIPFGSWICLACENLNYPSRATCSRGSCRARRETQPAFVYKRTTPSPVHLSAVACLRLAGPTYRRSALARKKARRA
eukprot:TRINITY_DN72945_c0_g1_i1.p1 TRINITY_DN72945_c0_g1~~TRINITY_DN72945_c0_g1_i1.p1  ORF type:complete len:591 (-),score=122.48 TRINITY_DN72945_c0_g1_i1:496-2112(-)